MHFHGKEKKSACQQKVDGRSQPREGRGRRRGMVEHPISVPTHTHKNAAYLASGATSAYVPNNVL